MRLTTIGCWVSSLIARSPAGRLRAQARCGTSFGKRETCDSALAVLDFLLELGEARAVGRVQHLTAELHRDLRCVTVHARQQHNLDDLIDLAALLDLLLELAGDRRHEAVRDQDAEEGADE